MLWCIKLVPKPFYPLWQVDALGGEGEGGLDSGSKQPPDPHSLMTLSDYPRVSDLTSTLTLGFTLDVSTERGLAWTVGQKEKLYGYGMVNLEKSCEKVRCLFFDSTFRWFLVPDIDVQGRGFYRIFPFFSIQKTNIEESPSCIS